MVKVSDMISIHYQLIL